MSRHSVSRLPGRAGVLRKQFLADPWPSLLLALLVLLVAAASTLWPRYILDMNGRQVPYQVEALSAQQRDMTAFWSATIVPAADREYTSAEDTWGPVFNGLEEVRQAQPEPLRSMLQQGDFFIELGKNDTGLVPPEGTEFARVHIQQRVDPHLAEHVDLVSGDWPEMVLNESPQLPAENIPEGTASGPIQVLLLDDAAKQLNLEAGDVFEQFEITGTFTPTDPDAARWAHMPNSTTVGKIFSGDSGLHGYVTAYLPPENPGSTGAITNNNMNLFYPLDGAAVPGDQVDLVTAQLIQLSATQQDLRVPDSEEGWNTTFNSPDIELSEPPIQTTFGTEVLSTFEGLSQQQRATASILAVVAAGPIGVALAVFALAARLITSRRQPALALATARGGSSAQVRGAMLLEGLALGLPAAVLGHYAANLVNANASGWTEWVPVALIGLAPAVLLAATASTASRSSRSDLSSKGASRLRVLVEVVVLVLAGLAVWRLFDRGLTGVEETPAASGEEAVAVQVDTGVDLLMAATPILLALAACVITLRIYPVPVHAVMAFFRGRRGLTNFLGAARAVRDPAGGMVPALAVILGVSVAVLSSVLSSTISAGAEQAAWQSAGGDVRLSGPSWSEEDVEPLREVDGVEQIAVIGSAADSHDLTGEVTERGLTVYVVDEALQEVWADTPVGPLPDELFSGSSTTPVVSGGSFEADTGTGTLGSRGEVEIVGHIDGLAGVRTRGAFVVVDRAAWEATGGTNPSGEVVLVAASDPGQTDELATALNQVVPNALAETPRDKLTTFEESPVTGAMLWFFAAAVVATTVLTALAVVFVQLMGAAARTSLFTVLRTLGLSQRQARALTAWELGPLVAIAFVVGAGLGVLVPWLLLRAINLTGLTGGATQPTLALDWTVLGPVILGILVTVAIAIAVSAAMSGRADLVNQLRRGEER
ncbi:ABC transporter permease [Ornithinimicrobium faecis]|uniref:ABC transporter permease n=1 Tax=Ornithinimicrobium faecis TaxID=2934158 RepID=A0ABY4YU70_9MICO|nr:ABC transporter permease [Ornithinimicrobium sp. HY1793]USQ80319.1 ABC transporter permease [Ornithinimicrobium sp. HY1793]